MTNEVQKLHRVSNAETSDSTRLGKRRKVKKITENYILLFNQMILHPVTLRILGEFFGI